MPLFGYDYTGGDSVPKELLYGLCHSGRGFSGANHKDSLDQSQIIGVTVDPQLSPLQLDALFYGVQRITGFNGGAQNRQCISS
jgi:hypothetical protein